MAGIGPLTPARRDTLLVILALGLLLGPVWVPTLNLGEPTYHYEHARITVGGENGLAYANSTPFQDTDQLISADIGCTIPEEARICALEHYATNHTIPTEGYTTNPDLNSSTFGGIEHYRYVLLNGTTYTTTLIPNRSVQNSEGLYRLDLGFDPVPLNQAISAVSLNSTIQREEIPQAVYQAATDGTGKSHHRVNIPPTPIRTENGTYYRVYFDGRTEPSPAGQFLGKVLPIGTPIIGLLALYLLGRRFEVSVSHHGTRTERRRR